MRKLDFLSNSPKTFIFEKSSNKTTFGGFLTLIYILIIFIMSFVYIYNYLINDKYIITFLNYRDIKSPEQIEKLKEDPKYNPTLKFKFELLDMYEKPLSNNFYLFDFRTNKIISRDKYYQYRVSDLDITVAYKCPSAPNCSLLPEDGIYEHQLFYILRVKFKQFKLNLQDKENPIKLEEETYIIEDQYINQDVAQAKHSFWKIIKVKEEKGLLDNFIGNKEEIIGGEFDENQIFNVRQKVFYYENNNKKNSFLLIYNFKTLNDFSYYCEYIRKKVSELDIAANICSLALTIFKGFNFGFAFFYSEKFDNYKIIDKILTSKGNSKRKKINDAKFDKSFPLLKVNDMDTLGEEDVNKIDEITETEKEEDSLPKFHFYNFIGNFFLCKCCHKNRVQNSITVCNNIMEKYYSIENLVYNQFMFENLLKDYKWNNPDLNSIKNIELIYKLQQLIKTDGFIQ